MPTCTRPTARHTGFARRFAPAFLSLSMLSPSGSCGKCPSFTSAFQPVRRIASSPRPSIIPLCASSPDGGESSPAAASSRGTARLSGPNTAGATGAVDSALTLLSSDGASIVLGLLGIVVCLFNRIAHIDDYDALTSVAGGADALGRQSRADLLGVFAAGAVLLNGVSKLDVTSALAESVRLEGTEVDVPVIYRDALAGVGLVLGDSSEDDLVWAMESVLDATPADTVVLMVHSGDGWMPAAVSGIVPIDEERRQALPEDLPTPILDRFLKESSRESYLPTLQALPGKAEFTYLPPNAQEALLVPVPTTKSRAVIVLGSDTAKSCTPRDVAWCQVLASRIGTFFT